MVSDKGKGRITLTMAAPTLEIENKTNFMGRVFTLVITKSFMMANTRIIKNMEKESLYNHHSIYTWDIGKMISFMEKVHFAMKMGTLQKVNLKRASLLKGNII